MKLVFNWCFRHEQIAFVVDWEPTKKESQTKKNDKTVETVAHGPGKLLPLAELSAGGVEEPPADWRLLSRPP